MIEHLSYSSVNQYLMCSRAWKFKYLDKIPTVKSADMAFGIAFHKTVQSRLVDKRKSLVNLWLDAWAEQSVDVVWREDQDPEDYGQKGLNMVQDINTQEAIAQLTVKKENGEPLIERKVELRLPDMPPVIGYVDIIQEDNIPVDLKTAGKSWGAGKPAGELQPLFYLAALKQMKIPTKGGNFKYVIFVKTKIPKVQVFEVAYTQAQAKWVIDLIKDVWNAIEAKAFPPNPTGWNCSEKWCDFWNICRGKE